MTNDEIGELRTSHAEPSSEGAVAETVQASAIPAETLERMIGEGGRCRIRTRGEG